MHSLFGLLAPAARVLLLALFVLGSACGGVSPRAVHAGAAESERPRLSASARALFERFDAERALATVGYVEQFFRVRGNAGYQQTIARIRDELSREGPGALASGAVRTLELGDVRESWTPRSAHLVLVAADGTETPLVTIASESDPDRACLLVNSDALAETTLEVVTIEAVRGGASPAGRLVLAAEAPSPTMQEVVRSDAAGVIVRWLESYHRAEEHPDVAQFGYLPDLRGTHVGFSVGERAYQLLCAAADASGGTARVRVAVDVVRAPSAATAIEARIEGTDPTLPAVVFVAHVDEPGANDNASGVAALVELARAIRRAVDEGAVPPPLRSIVLVWGQEIEVSSAWLDGAGVPAGVGLVFDMVGSDPAETGAPFLVERMPDPGAVWLRAPDVHSEWGESEVPEASLRGHFLNDTTIAAIDVVRAIDGPWETRAHPYEGGSDHVSFLGHDLPALLGWHFTDDAYHTTRDRLARVSAREMRRVSTAMGAVAIALASGSVEDRREILEVVEGAAGQRLEWATAAGRETIAAGGDSALEVHVLDAWALWYDQALVSIGSWGAAEPALDEAIAAARARVTERAVAARAALAP